MYGEARTVMEDGMEALFEQRAEQLLMVKCSVKRGYG